MRSEKKTRAAGAEWSGGVSVWAVKVCGSAAGALGFVSHASSRICSSAAAIVLFAVWQGWQLGRGGDCARHCIARLPPPKSDLHCHAVRRCRAVLCRGLTLSRGRGVTLILSAFIRNISVARITYIVSRRRA